MSKSRILNKKFLFAAVLCLACTTGIANADEDRNVKIINENYQSITNKQNILNYGSKWGADTHDSSGWILDIENTVFKNNTQSGKDNGLIIKGCSTPIVLKNVKILNNKSTGNSPIIDVWKGAANEVSDGDAPNHDSIITIINSEISGNNNEMFLQKNAVGNIIAQNGGTVEFSDNGKNNTFRIMSNASGAIVNFNADSDSKVIINDILQDSDNKTFININKSGLSYQGLIKNSETSKYEPHTYEITETGGEYNFNALLKAGTLNVYNDANIKFGSYEHPNGDNPVTTYGSLNVQNFTNDTNGGTLDFRNNNADSNSLGNVKLGSDIKVNIDFISSDLTTATGDTFTSNVNAASNGKIYIDKINLNLPDGKNFKDITGNFNFQVLKNTGSGNNLQLALSGEALELFGEAQNPIRKMMENEHYVGESKHDSLNAETKTTNFSDKFWNYHLEGNADVYCMLFYSNKNVRIFALISRVDFSQP